MPKRLLTNQQILTKAIQKAIDGGWEPKIATKSMSVFENVMWHAKEHKAESIIFNHEFCKALWGVKPLVRIEYRSPPEAGGGRIPQWQHKLQQMVTAEDPIQYLGENI